MQHDRLLARVLRSRPGPGGIVHSAIVTLPDEDGREVAVPIDAADVARVTDACMDHHPVEVERDGGWWRLVREA